MDIEHYAPESNPSAFNIQLAYGVKIVDCRYKCGGKFVVTTRRERPPAHIECSIKRSVEHMHNMHNKTGDDYLKYVQRLSGWADQELGRITSKQ